MNRDDIFVPVKAEVRRVFLKICITMAVTKICYSEYIYGFDSSRIGTFRLCEKNG